MAHYEERLERDLNEIRQSVADLCAQAQKALENAVQSVRTGNQKLAYYTILGDARINRAYRELDGKCHQFIAVHLPSAGHLRHISATLRTIIQLERLGDYAVTIAREAIQLSSPPDEMATRELEIVATNSLKMLSQAVLAFNEDNADGARATMAMAEDMEHTLDGIYADLTRRGDPEELHDLIAMFVIFNMIKRISDQAKNICEETIFAVTGESKPRTIPRILFVDEDNASLAPMAEAVARKLFPDDGVYDYAARNPGQEIDPRTVSFMDSHGYDLSLNSPKSLNSLLSRIDRYFVVVSLQGDVDTYIENVPFHTSALTWDVGEPRATDNGDADNQLEALYREIAAQVRELMELLGGVGAP